MNTWTDEDVAAFLKVMDPADDRTGGGTASAVAGAMGAGLVGMVARVSIGREGLGPAEVYREIDAGARRLTTELMAGGREDAEAFGAVMRAYGLPKGTEAEKAERSKRIRLAMVGATRVPIANGERCLGVLKLGRRLERSFNENAASDLAVGMSLARAGLEGCLANVEINLPSVKDEDARAELAARAAGLRTEYRNLEGGQDG